MSEERTIYRIVKNPNNPYVMVDKGFINNPNLSWKAKGILLYLLSKPDDWEVYQADLMNHASDGRDSCRSGLSELEAAGHIRRVQLRDESGRMNGVECSVYEIPTGDGFSGAGGAEAGEPPPTNNNITNNKKETNTNDDLPPKVTALFNELWDLYPRKRGKGQVSAASKRKLYQVGREELVRCIDRFSAEMKAQNRPEDKVPYGSTFFTSGYIDYLDENYNEPVKKKPFKITV